MTLLDGVEEKRDARCPRVWEAEAVHDGRLTGDGRAAFERHTRACAPCARQLVELAALDALANASMPIVDDVPELQRRRLRAELLKRANGETLSTEERRTRAARRRHGALVGFAFAAAAASIGLWVRAHRAHAPIAVAAIEPAAAPVVALPFEVENVSAATWTTSASKGETRVTLTSGVAAFHVEKVKTSDRFFVGLPDGEIEVRGTRFVVDVRAGETRDVAVTEGVVALRLAGHGELVLVAGEHWSQSAVTSSIASSAPAPLAAPAAVASVAPLVAPSVAKAAVSASAEPRSRAGDDWIAAMAAFNAGRNADGERAFEAFTRAYPTDARCEDAMFLRAVAASRRGDKATAAADAKAYLAMYPHGLRTTQAERLAAGSE